MQRLFPGHQVTIGPSFRNPQLGLGFYYDFELREPLHPEDLEEEIEAAQRRDQGPTTSFVRDEVTSAEAIKPLREKGETFKVGGIIQDLAKGAKTLTLYRHGPDWVYCLPGPRARVHYGPHRRDQSSDQRGPGAYWRGRPAQPAMCSAYYGTAFFNQKALEAHLPRLEEAKKRDHRKLGKELELFITHPYAPGSAFWLPKGAVLYQTLSDPMRDAAARRGLRRGEDAAHLQQGALGDLGPLGEVSGEHVHLRERGADLSLKPMNCPSHMLIFGSRRRSYRELPLRLHDQGVLHRNEASGTLGGLTRVRQLCQDDAHLFVLESQIEDEVGKLIDLIDRVYGAFRSALHRQALHAARKASRRQLALGRDRERPQAGPREARPPVRRWLPEMAPFIGPKIDFDVTDSDRAAHGSVRPSSSTR